MVFNMHAIVLKGNKKEKYDAIKARVSLARVYRVKKK